MKVTTMSIYQNFVARRGLKVGLLIVAALLISFALLAQLVQGGATLAFDNEILLAIHSRATPFFDSVFSIGTNLGGAPVVALVSVVMVSALVRRRLYVRALTVALIIGGSSVANIVLKNVFERARPELWVRLVQEQSFSFPSGHAMASMALASALILLVWNTRWRNITIGIAALYVLFIGFSRLYLGVHYPTDILGGWIAATVWTAFVIILFRSKRIVYTR